MSNPSGNSFDLSAYPRKSAREPPAIEWHSVEVDGSGQLRYWLKGARWVRNCMASTPPAWPLGALATRARLSIFYAGERPARSLLGYLLGDDIDASAHALHARWQPDRWHSVPLPAQGQRARYMKR
jgi:hypothetical protein